jgi:preprotein translocase subunit SecA
MNLIKTIFGTKNDRDLKRMQPLVDQINELEKSYQSLSDDQLKAKTAAFKERVAKGESLDDLLCEAAPRAKCAGTR